MLEFVTLPQHQRGVFRIESGNIALHPIALPYPWASPFISDLREGERTGKFLCKGWWIPTVYGETLMVFLANGKWAIEAQGETVGHYDNADQALDTINSLRPGQDPMRFALYQK